MKELDLGHLEDVNVTFGKHAFAPRRMYCDRCSRMMQKISVEMPVSEDVRVRLRAFRCVKCGTEMLGLDEAKKLDRALAINRLLARRTFALKRRLSNDGDNYIFRLPKEFTQGKKHAEVRILPLEHDEALIKW